MTLNTFADMSINILTIEQEYLMQSFKCSVGGRVATYVSGPITTGRRFIDWYIVSGHLLEIDSKLYQKNKHEYVLKKNELDIIEVSEALRKNSATSVIEPASLSIDTWDQQDYYRFWTELMRRFVSRVVVLDGWQYSLGCVIEFHNAIKCDIPVETVNGILLDEDNARKLILDAADDIVTRGASFDVLQRIAHTLRIHEF